jgi:hypothetical protein
VVVGGSAVGQGLYRITNAQNQPDLEVNSASMATVEPWTPMRMSPVHTTSTGT